MINFNVLILFNTKRPHLGNNTDGKWLDYRLDIFRRFTLRSLLNQDSGPFKIWMLCSPESEEILTPKIEALKERFPTMALPDFIFDAKAACANLTPNPEPVYFLKIDSDDAYRSDTITRTTQLIGYRDGISLLMFCNGFIYNIKTRELSEFTRWSICSYAVFYPAQSFDYNSFQKYCLCNQTTVRDTFNPRLDMSQALCCLDHDKNLHSDPRRKGLEIGRRTGQRKCPKGTEGILKNYGIETGDAGKLNMEG